MTPELNSIAARIREFISRTSGTGVSPVSSSASNSDGEFNSLVLELFALQFSNNVPYRYFCLSRGIVKPGSVEHWTQIPAVPASAFKELELTCLAPAERTTVFHSSGTTEQRPSRHFHCAESLALYEASLWSWFQPHVLAGVGQAFQPAGAGDFPVARSEHRTGKSGEPAGCKACPTPVGRWQLAILTPPPVAAPNSSLVHMFQTVRRKSAAGQTAYLGDLGADGAWTLNFTRAETAMRAAIDAGQPLVLLGTAFNFVHLLDELAARNLRFELPPGSVAMETGGYKGRSRELPKAELHALITKLLGVASSQIICEYGMSELSSQAYDGVAGDEWRVTGGTKTSRHAPLATRHFHFPPWARAQIISPETGREVAEGETGRVRVFDLANAFSVLAVQTEDLAIRRGAGFELLGRAPASEPRGCSLMASFGVPPLGGPCSEPPKGGTPNPAARKS